MHPQPWLCIFQLIRDFSRCGNPNPNLSHSCSLNPPRSHLGISDQALQAATKITFLGRNLEVAVDDRDCKQNTRTTAQRAKHITRHGQRTDARTTKGRRSGNDSLQLLVHRLLPVPGHNEPLFLESLCNVARRRARNFDPRLGEDGAGDDDECNVDDSVDRVEKRIGKVQRWGHVVGNTTAGEELGGAFLGFPCADELDEEVVGEAGVEGID